MNFGTYFFRNRPQLELIRRLTLKKSEDADLKIAVLGCSKGAGVYSILWTLHSARPDLKITMHALDISSQVVQFAEKGVYSLLHSEFHRAPIFERITDPEMSGIFDVDREKGEAKVKSSLKKGILWHVGDAADSRVLDTFERQDIVVANTFLCHMQPSDAERCLRNLAHLVVPGGHLIVSGVDLDVRTKVARNSGWQPIRDLMEEIHDGDPTLTSSWPLKYWGLEPLNKGRKDWTLRYASAFQLGEQKSSSEFPPSHQEQQSTSLKRAAGAGH